MPSRSECQPAHVLPGSGVIEGAPADDHAPKWISADLIRETLRVWQPYYRAELTVRDAREILEVFGRLISVLDDAV